MLIANILGIFTFLYLLWRTLKDDYHYEKVFNFALLALTGLLIGVIVSFLLPHNYWFWLDALCISATSFIGIKKLKMRFFEVYEGLVAATLPWLSFVFLSDSITKSSLSSFLVFWTNLICIFIFYFSTSHYRSFTWYKSGRVGVAAILTTIMFFLFRTITSIFFVDVISFAPKIESYLSGALVFFLFLVLYKLSKSYEK